MMMMMIMMINKQNYLRVRFRVNHTGFVYIVSYIYLNKINMYRFTNLCNENTDIRFKCLYNKCIDILYAH